MKMIPAWLALGALALATGLAPAAAVSETQPAADLRAAFATPPRGARPWVYWFWMDGNLSREGITADLEAMARAGLGGVIIMEVDVGVPKGPVKFMSPEWRQLFKHVVREAERLGLQITLNAGPGWTGSGGPWVKPEQSMQHLVASAVEVAGPGQFRDRLPQPKRRPAFFGDGNLPAALEKAKNEFYRDVVVLACPTPDQPATIGDIDEKANYVRAPYSSQPGVRPCFTSPAQYPELPAGAVIPSARILDLTSRLDAEGRLDWEIPEGKWTILRFGRTSTGANTRPAPAPGVGLECDKLDPAALDAHYEAFIGALLREIGPRESSADVGWNSLHIDSWEMGAQNWTAAFREEFQRRRGYDLLRYLPTLTGRVVDSLEVSERFLWDLRQTVSEMIVANHATHLKNLSREDWFKLSIEPYDMTPCADVSLGGVADVPMCEFWMYGFNTFFSVFESASAAHTLGRPIVAAEAFTSGDAERWLAHPASMKPLGDWALSAGINRIVFHRYQHQPWLDRRPGMTMGSIGIHWERTQTWWDMVPAYHSYLARCQHLLRQGLPVADICYLVAEGAPQVFRPPSSAIPGNPPERPGYNFDGCAPEVLLAGMSVADGRLVLPGGMSYRVLVLPERETITPALLRKVRDLVAAGATVVGPRPRKSPSLGEFPRCDTEIQQLAGELWGDCDGQKITEHRLGAGRVVWERGPAAEARPEPRNPLASARWIWHAEGNPAASAPVGKRYFHRSFSLPGGAPVAAAVLHLTADNSFEAWVNGHRAGAGDNFHETFPLDVKAMLKPGTNQLAILGENGGEAPNPAGLIACLEIRFQDGSTRQIVTDRQWVSSTTVTAAWLGDAAPPGQWTAALELGAQDMPPWNRGGNPAPPPPEQYCGYPVVAGILGRLGLAPDFESDGPLRSAHRRVGEADFYFVASRADQGVQASCTFRVAGKTPELWDPVNGSVRPLPEFQTRDGRTTVPLRFAPHQSFFVVFQPGATTAATGLGRNFPETTPLATLAGPWEVAFDPQWGGPARIQFQALDDWSQRPEEGIRHYSGVAVYRQSFSLAADQVEPKTNPASRLFLDLGAVRNLARVRLNGRDLGVVWCAPWRVEITGVVQPTDNRLEIEVANLWPNRLIGDQFLPAEKRLTWSTWNPYTKRSPLLESGLRGPVTVTALR